MNTEEYWDTKVRAAEGDPRRAVGVDDPALNRCIERVQQLLVTRALRRAVSRMENCHSVFDFGCGAGRWAAHITNNGMQYSGADLSGRMVELAKLKNPNAHIKKLNAGGPLPWPNATFDLAMSIAVLHHNPPSEQERYICELSRILKKGGNLLIFESVRTGATSGAVASGLEFPRSHAGWCQLAEMYHLRMREVAGARYQILARVVERYFSNRAPRLRRAALRLDAFLAPRLSRWIP
ncbi:MAG: class I SAM-dependent methyltransferase, partial [Planctomycetota bacterium]